MRNNSSHWHWYEQSKVYFLVLLLKQNSNICLLSLKFPCQTQLHIPFQLPFLLMNNWCEGPVPESFFLSVGTKWAPSWIWINASQQALISVDAIFANCNFSFSLLSASPGKHFWSPKNFKSYYAFRPNKNFNSNRPYHYQFEFEQIHIYICMLVLTFVKTNFRIKKN